MALSQSAYITVMAPLFSPSTPNPARPRTRQYESLIPIPKSVLIQGLEAGIEELGALIHYYIDDTIVEPQDGHLVFLSGRFSAQANKPLDITPTELSIMFRDIDVSSPEYEQRLPEPVSAIIIFCGKTISISNSTISTEASNSLRSFDVQTASYTSNGFESFCIRCYLPSTARFAKTPLPDKGSFVMVNSVLVGRHGASGHIAVLVKDFVFLGTRERKEEPVTKTPEKRKFNWGPKTPRKERCLNLEGGEGKEGMTILESGNFGMGSGKEGIAEEDND